ncbi:MAG: hypothetical protein IKG87_14960 [Clostridia bacterium]|nr:hypothetical protein [Clostridia bacterium]
MKNMKRIIAVVMAIAMIFALSATALAALDTPYITKVNTAVLSDSLWTKTVTVGTPQDVSFYVAIATDTYESGQYVTNWSYFPCSGTQEQADAFVQSKVSATVTAGSDKLLAPLEIKSQFIETIGGVNYYAARITAKVSSSATPGMVRINVTSTETTNTNTNFTVIVESANTFTSATYVTVEAYDQINDTYAGAYDVTVSAAGSSASNLFYHDSASAQSYATAANTMDNLLAVGEIADVDAYSGYVDTVVMYDFNHNEVICAPYITQDFAYVGWVYGVFREISGIMTYVTDSAEISASAFELEDGDYVIWAYGEYYSALSFIEHFFDVEE